MFDSQNPELNTFQPTADEEPSDSLEILDLSGSALDMFDTIEDEEDTAIEYETF